MPDLQRALEIAVTAHADQKQKDGSPYALHPIRVALTLRNETEQIVAVLHDVVEDTPWTIEQLRTDGFSPEVLEAVSLLTKTDGEDYFDYIERVAPNPIARAVKLADLTDNLNVRRIPHELTQSDRRRIKTYHRAWLRLSIEAH